MLDYRPTWRFLVTEDADMAMGRQKSEQQSEFWVPTADLPQSPGHPFYEQLNQVLAAAGFDRFAEAGCRKFYAAKLGRPSVPPGVYFRMLMVGYFEKLPSERQIAWRCADSLSLRAFLGLAPKENSPDDSSLNRTRLRIDLETHQAIFDWVLKRLAEHELLKGRTLGVDGSTMEANAAMRSIVRRETGQSYREFLTDLAQASGIETPTAEDLAKFDRKRKGKKCSNDDWFNPNDPDAKVAKMKDGTTHLAHKNEHAVDLETGAIVAPAVHPADEGDTTTMWGTLEQACNSLQEVREDQTVQADTSSLQVKEVVVDKGYHSAQTLVNLEEVELRGYVSEPDRGRQKWTAKQAEQQAFKRQAQQAVYRNRRRRKGDHSKRLHRKRGELVERSFEHVLDDGGMRRMYLRGRENIAKRYLIHTAAFNLGLIMRKLTGFGTPRGWADARRAAVRGLRALWNGLVAHLRRWALIPAVMDWPTSVGHDRPLAA
jgi:transposase